MKQLYFIKILSDLSLIFASCWYFLSFLGEISLLGIIYSMMSLAVFGIYIAKKENKSGGLRLEFLLIIFFAFARTLADIGFVMIMIAYSLYLIYKGLDQLGYYLVIDRFNQGLVLTAAMFAISIPTRTLGILESKSVSFIIIYLVTSVMLIRSFRLLQYEGSTKELNKINLRYSVLVMGMSFLLSIEQIRNILAAALLQLYNWMVDLVVYLLYGLLLVIGYGLQYLIIFVKRLLEGRIIKMPPSESSDFPLDDILKLEGQDLITAISKSWVFNLIVHIVLVSLIFLMVYVIIRVLMRNYHDKKEGEEYTETREFIIKDKGSKAFGKLALPFKPGRYDQYIRYYYKKFLKLCQDKKIDIKNSDTTFEIGGKSSGQFDSRAVWRMRQIYVKIRYGEEPGDKQTARDFHDSYKKLKR